MGVIIRQGIKGTIANYLGIVIGAINTLYIFPKMLSVEEYGLIRLLLDISLVFSSFAQLGMSSTMIRFFPYFQDEKKKHNGFFFYSLIPPLIGFILFSIIFFFYFDDITKVYAQSSPLLNTYLYYIYPLTFILLFILYFETISQLFLRITIIQLIREVYLRLFTAIAVILYFFGIINQQILIVSIVSIYLGALLFNWAYSVYTFKFSILNRGDLLNKQLILEILKYSSFVVLASLSGVIVSKIDTIMLGASKGLADTGIYSIAFFIATFVETPRRAITAIIMPVVSTKIKEKKYKDLKELNLKTTNNLLIICGFLLVLIYSNTDDIFRIMPKGEIYAIGKNVILLIGLSKLIEASSGINSPLIGYSHLYKYGTLLTFLYSFIGVATNIILIPTMGIVGAAVATLFTVAIVNIYLHYLIYKHYKFTSINRTSFNVLSILLITYLISIVLPNTNYSIINIIYKSICLTLLYGAVIYHLKLSVDFNNTLNRLFAFLTKFR